jgi:FkbM family methyltransferase
MPARGGRARHFLRRAARSAAARAGQRDRFAELETVFDAGLRRHMLDEFALQAVLAAVLRPDSCVVDVGANVGTVLEEVVRLAPQGRHVAYEPIPELHDDLVRRFPGVDVRRAAASDEAGASSFSHVTAEPALSGLLRRDDLPPGIGEVREIEVRLERLDDALPEGFAPALIKIDVEGAEVKVLRGARETLAAHRPLVVFEHGAGGADLYDTGSEELWDILDGAGLRVFSLVGEGPYARAEFAALFHEPQWNYLAVPSA